MDKNRNGVLSMAELENVFNLMGITDNKTVKAIIAQWDEVGNGTVSFQDFVKYLCIPYSYGGCLRPRWACLPSSCHAKSKLYCGPNGPTASIFYGI